MAEARTRMRCGWLVANDGIGHTLWKDAELVWEGDRTLHAGPRFEGRVDREMDASGKLVARGFIDTHVHSGLRASHRLISDVGRPTISASPSWRSASREGMRVGGDRCYVRPDDNSMAIDLQMNARFTVAELLRNGITTFVEFGSQLRVQQALLEEVQALGIRAYLVPGFDSGRWVGDAAGVLTRVEDEAAGEREFALALAFTEQHDGACDGRVRGILVPREIETYTMDLLRRAAIEAKARNVPVASHPAYNILEVYDMLRQHQRTSIELLEDVGLMSETLNIGHGKLTCDNPAIGYSGSHDLEVMGRHRCSISQSATTSAPSSWTVSCRCRRAASLASTSPPCATPPRRPASASGTAGSNGTR